MRQKDLLPHVIWLQFCYQRISEFGELKHAVRLLLSKRHRDSLADVINYSSAISACEKGEHWQRAIGLLVEMGNYDFLPNVIS